MKILELIIQFITEFPIAFAIIIVFALSALFTIRKMNGNKSDGT